jgi:hypothetical protein
MASPSRRKRTSSLVRIGLVSKDFQNAPKKAALKTTLKPKELNKQDLD